MAWTCENCNRTFARRGQGHECAPAMTVDEYFSTGPAFERPIFDVVVAHLRTLGEPELEPVSVGVFVKRDGVTVAQLRPKTKWVAISFWLRRSVRHDRMSRKPYESGSKTWHVVNIRSANEVDDVVLDWMTEAWDDAAGR